MRPCLALLPLALTVLATVSGTPARAADCRLPGVETTTGLTEKRGTVRFSNGFSGKQLEAKRRRAGGAAARPTGIRSG